MRPKRNLRPSTKISDPNNVMNLKRKRSTANSIPASHRARLLLESDNEEAMEPDDSKTEDAASDAGGNATSRDSAIDDLSTDCEEAYALTKALGDADREVSIPNSCYVIF